MRNEAKGEKELRIPLRCRAANVHMLSADDGTCMMLQPSPEHRLLHCRFYPGSLHGVRRTSKTAMLPGPPCAPIVLVIQILMRSWMVTVLIGGESVRSMWQRLRVRKTTHRNTDSGSKYILTHPPKTTRTLAVSITYLQMLPILDDIRTRRC